VFRYPAHSPFAHFRGKLVLIVHGSIYMDASRFARDFELV
jgi:hypothetical protein